MFGSITSALMSAVARIVEWRRRQVARAELESLDDRALADIGLTRGDIPLVLAGRHTRSLEPLVGVVPRVRPANSNAASRRAA